MYDSDNAYFAEPFVDDKVLKDFKTGIQKKIKDKINPINPPTRMVNVFFLSKNDKAYKNAVSLKYITHIMIQKFCELNGIMHDRKIFNLFTVVFISSILLLLINTEDIDLFILLFFCNFFTSILFSFLIGSKLSTITYFQSG